MKSVNEFFLSIVMLVFCTSVANAQNIDWFTLVDATDPNGSVINMSAWLDKPAGVHGFVRMDGDRLVFDDGTPVKFWGTNIAGNKPFMPRDEAVIGADFLSRDGFSAVRFDKFTEEAIDGLPSTLVMTEAF